MLNQLHTAADLAADCRRALRAEADAYRLARTARGAVPPTGAPGARRRGWLHLLGIRRTAGAA